MSDPSSCSPTVRSSTSLHCLWPSEQLFWPPHSRTGRPSLWCCWGGGAALPSFLRGIDHRTSLSATSHIFLQSRAHCKPISCIFPSHTLWSLICSLAALHRYAASMGLLATPKLRFLKRQAGSKTATAAAAAPTGPDSAQQQPGRQRQRQRRRRRRPQSPKLTRSLLLETSFLRQTRRRQQSLRTTTASWSSRPVTCSAPLRPVMARRQKAATPEAGSARRSCASGLARWLRRTVWCLTRTVSRGNRWSCWRCMGAPFLQLPEGSCLILQLHSRLLFSIHATESPTERSMRSWRLQFRLPSQALLVACSPAPQHLSLCVAAVAAWPPRSTDSRSALRTLQRTCVQKQ